MTDPGADERRRAVRDLVEMARPVAEAVDALHQFDWDSESELVQFTRATGARVLRAYLDGRVDDGDLHRWAEAVEGRDDIGYEDGHEELLSRFLFELATPELFEPLTPDVANGWLEKLSTDPPTRDPRAYDALQP